jgi:hypothetical protein
MRETRSSGSVEGVMSNRDPYSDFQVCLHLVCGWVSFRHRHDASVVSESQLAVLLTSDFCAGRCSVT